MHLSSTPALASRWLAQLCCGSGCAPGPICLSRLRLRDCCWPARACCSGFCASAACVGAFLAPRLRDGRFSALGRDFFGGGFVGLYVSECVICGFIGFCVCGFVSLCVCGWLCGFVGSSSCVAAFICSAKYVTAASVHLKCAKQYRNVQRAHRAPPQRPTCTSCDFETFCSFSKHFLCIFF